MNAFKQENERVKLSEHQRRILIAMLAIEKRHEWRWWSRNAIGRVVGSTGFHRVIQRTTMMALKKGGFICTEWSTWSQQMRSEVKCDCCCFKWGLTHKGRAAVENVSARWTTESIEAIDMARYEHPLFRRDEDEHNLRPDDRR